MLVKYFVLLFTLVSVSAAVGQSQEDEIRELQRIANEYKERAIKAEALAARFEKEAVHARYLYLANEIALYSLQVQDKELAGLLAVQAHQFNLNYSGYPSNSKIYAGLFNAIKRYRSEQNFSSIHEAKSLVSDSVSIFSIGKDGELFRWTKNNKEWIGEALNKVQVNGAIQAVTLNNQGNLIAIATSDVVQSNTANIDLVSIGGQAKRLETLKSKIERIIFSPDGNGLYALCRSGQLIIHSDFNITREVIKPIERILSMDINADGTKLAGLSFSGDLVVWNTSDYSSVVHKIFSKSNEVNSIAFLPGSKDKIFAASDSALKLIDVNNGQVLRNLLGNPSKITQIQFSHSGTLLATLSVDSKIRVWNLKNIRQWPFVIEESLIEGFIFSPDDTQIMSVKDYKVHSWFLNTRDMANELCGLIKRNLNVEEWNTLISSDLPYLRTCPNLPVKNEE